MLLTPGLSREDRFVSARAALATGVPGFVGFGTMAGGLDVVERIDHFTQRWVKPAIGRSYLDAAVSGFFANGGARCFVLALGEPSGGLPTLTRALDPGRPLAQSDPKELDDLRQRFAALTEMDLVAAPDVMTLPDGDDRSDQKQAQRVLLAHCTALGNRLAILDAPRVAPLADPGAVLARWSAEITLGGAPENGAIYFPWLTPLGGDSPVPPSGHVAGIVARSDARVGVFKAPANEELLGVVDLDFLTSDAAQGRLNQSGINAVRAFPGRGFRVFGARTLSLDPEWCYVNVRRLFITLSRWIDQNMGWATFEANDERLWIRIRRELSVYLEGIWREGGLRGTTANQAFFVKCDAETNPDQVRAQGEVVTEIGLAAALPAEFIIVRITQSGGATRIS
jgi:uncharacterized protein